MNENLKILMEFQGYGNPKGDFWFIGVEEGHSIDTDEKLKPYKEKILTNNFGDYSKQKDNFKKNPDNKNSRYTDVYDIIGNILLLVIGNNVLLVDFLNQNLFRPTGNNFYTLLFPVGKKKEKAPLDPATMRFLGINDMDEYYTIAECKRFPAIHQLWMDHRPKFTVCFGEKRWSDFAKLLKINLADSEVIDDGRMRSYPGGIYFVPFFRYGQNLMTHERIKILADHIKHSR